MQICTLPLKVFLFHSFFLSLFLFFFFSFFLFFSFFFFSKQRNQTAMTMDDSGDSASPCVTISVSSVFCIQMSFKAAGWDNLTSQTNPVNQPDKSYTFPLHGAWTTNDTASSPRILSLSQFISESPKNSSTPDNRKKSRESHHPFYHGLELVDFVIQLVMGVCHHLWGCLL